MASTRSTTGHSRPRVFADADAEAATTKKSTAGRKKSATKANTSKPRTTKSKTATGRVTKPSTKKAAATKDKDTPVAEKVEDKVEGVVEEVKEVKEKTTPKSKAAAKSKPAGSATKKASTPRLWERHAQTTILFLSSRPSALSAGYLGIVFFLWFGVQGMEWRSFGCTIDTQGICDKLTLFLHCLFHEYNNDASVFTGGMCARIAV
ncbi:hypothetical protein BJ546DRAFT_952675 [Cryomyces antarcticus]